MGDTYTYTCQTDFIPYDSYALDGGMTTECESTGEWSLDPPPICTS